MNRKLKVLSLSLSLSLLAPSVALAADSALDVKINGLDKEISELEAQYDALIKTYRDIDKSSKAYVNKDGKYVPNKKAIEEHLFKVASELDGYVSNVTPSLEQAMLRVYFLNGAKGDGFVIRPKNANDFYNYLKGYFVMKEGKDSARYDALLIEYVNAISDSVVLPELDSATDTIYEEVKETREKLDRAKSLRKYYKREKKKDIIDRLEKAIERSELTVRSCKQLMKYSPKTIAPVRGKLENMVKEQEALIIRSKRALNKYINQL